MLKVKFQGVRSVVIHLKAGHVQFNRKPAIFGLQITLQGRFSPDRRSRETKTLGAKVSIISKYILMLFKTGEKYI